MCEPSPSPEKTCVVFSALAEYCGAYGPFCSDQTLVYKNVVTNIGDAYNPCKGIFVAPVKGVYFFTFFYYGGGKNPTQLKLMKNCECIVKACDPKSGCDTADNGGNAVFLELQKGDQVSVCLTSGSHVLADCSTSFSGYLAC